MKTKGQSTNCDGKNMKILWFELIFNYWLFVACGAVINLASYKEHAVECKMKLSKVR